MTDCCDIDVIVFGHYCQPPLPFASRPTAGLRRALDAHSYHLARLRTGLAELHQHLKPETTHAWPPGGGLTPCCKQTPFELPRTDRLTLDPGAVTCTDQENP